MIEGDNQVILAIISGIPAVLAAWWSRRSASKMDVLRIEVNGRMSKLIEEAKNAAYHAGMIDGIRSVQQSSPIVQPQPAPKEEPPHETK